MKQHIFLHIPKTAGSSVRTLLQQNYPTDATIGFSGDADPIKWYKSRPADIKRKYALVHGHFPYGIHGGLSRYSYFTFLRCPVARHFSEYDFLRRYEPNKIHDEIVREGITAEDWASIFDRHTMFRDLMTRYVSGESHGPDVDRLSLEKAKLHIRREFAVVGLAERFDESVLILARRLGWKSLFYLTRNVSGDRTKPTQAMTDAAAQGLRRDLELYAFAEELFNKLPEHRMPLFKDALAEYRDVRSWLESHVVNNANGIFTVGQELPPLDEIVRQHRATPALDRFLAKATGSAATLVDTPPREATAVVESPEAAAKRMRASLLAEPPRPLPPLRMMRFIGSNSRDHYLLNIREYVADLIGQAKLTPASHVLDIGCGCGRVASGLTRYLDARGSYLGLDVWQEGISWASKHLTEAFPNFTFQAVPAANNYYLDEDSGKGNAFDLSGVPSNRFDVIFAVSLFTHLKLADARQYLELVARALSPNGVAYLTFFTMDEQALAWQEKTGNHKVVEPNGDGMWYGYSKQDFFSGFAPDLLLKQFDECGLEIVKQTPGHWAKKPGARLYQDWFLLRRAR
jgi:cyclopropane fatty-acyl-phospholipid synthase-like methyltransferase